MILTPQRLESLQAYVQEQCRIRCIPTVVSIQETTNKRNEPKLEMTSTPFNTIPVIHSAITLDVWSSYIGQHKTYEEVIVVKFSVHASYEGNGVHMFDVHGFFPKEGDEFRQDSNI